MDGLLFVLNPMAGGGRAKSLESLIKEAMKDNEIDYDIIFTSKEGDATRIARESHYKRIIAVGGDGTVNEVAKGLIERGHGIMGIIPAGTGNDLSRSLKIPMEPLRAIECIIRGRIRPIDIGIVNENYLLNIASFGFDAEVVKNSSRFKRLFGGKIAYILGTIFTLFKFKKREVTLEIDGKTYSERLILLAVGNGKYYGGGMKILPKASLDDRYLHLCLIKDASNLLLLLLFPTIFTGRHLGYSKYVKASKAKNIKIIYNGTIDVNIDGEIIHEKNEIMFSLSNSRLNMIYGDANFHNWENRYE